METNNPAEILGILQRIKLKNIDDDDKRKIVEQGIRFAEDAKRAGVPMVLADDARMATPFFGRSDRILISEPYLQMRLSGLAGANPNPRLTIFCKM